MRNPRIGMVGLGGIAQKAYLPILTKETDWSFIGAYSPNKENRKAICNQYRIQDYNSLLSLAEDCDAMFVHSSTESHYEIVSELLNRGLDIYVDKPLAATVTEAEQLVELGIKRGRKLMVGFNRRFSPMYIEAKAMINDSAWVHVEKHRTDSVGPHSYEFTMLDDYLHLVDTARWLVDGDLNVQYKNIQVNKEKQLVSAQHVYETPSKITMNTAMHRKAGTNLEQIELVTEGAIVRVKNMNIFEVEQNNTITTKIPGSWETVLKQRGFVDAVQHFIVCLHNGEQPLVDGTEGLKSQQLVSELTRM